MFAAMEASGVHAYCRSFLLLFALLSLFAAAAQLVMTVKFLRYSTASGEETYIWMFTVIGGITFVYSWHVARLIYVLIYGTLPEKSLVAPKIWFYTSLTYLITNVAQVGYFFSIEDWLPAVIAAFAIVFCVLQFIIGNRKLHHIKKQTTKSGADVELITSSKENMNSIQQTAV